MKRALGVPTRPVHEAGEDSPKGGLESLFDFIVRGESLGDEDRAEPEQRPARHREAAREALEAGDFERASAGRDRRDGPRGAGRPPSRPAPPTRRLRITPCAGVLAQAIPVKPRACRDRCGA